MPFPMVHLSIAKIVLDKTLEIVRPSEFLLGSIAPDSVYFRPGYHSDMKKVSHLCVGDEKWGLITNNSEWTENVLKFLTLNKGSENIDFILGYCGHILADIRNNIYNTKIRTPYRMAREQELGRELGSVLHKELAAINLQLYQTLPERDAIWELLKQSQCVDLCGVADSLDIENMKASILCDQFSDREACDVSTNRCITMKDVTDFIANESEYIREQLFSGRWV